MGEDAELQRRVRWRRWLAVAAAPIGTLPFALLLSWVAGEFGSFGSAFAYYGWNLPVTAAMISAPVGLVVWALMAWSKAPRRAWVIIPVFVAAFALLLCVVGGPGPALIGTVVLGVPVSLTYCLVAGVPWGWRRADPPPLS